MDYRQFEAEDFLLDPSFREYCLGKNENAVQFWEQWMTANPAKQNDIRQARQLYAALNGNHSAHAFLEDVKAFRARFAAHLGESESDEHAREVEYQAGEVEYHAEKEPTKTSAKKWYYLGATVAAAAIIVTVMMTTTRRPPVTPVEKPSAQTSEYVQTSKAGERKSFQLPDGSKVMLNAGSSLRIPAGFNRISREITLEGEAFFDVTHDAAKPFVIHTNLMDIKVLGTAFNIKAYPGDPLTETSLLTGSVEVLVKDGRNQKFILHPREKIVVPNIEKLASTPAKTKARTNLTKYKIEKLRFAKRDSTLVEISWTESRLAFDDDSFKAIALQLERWYNISIRFEDEAVKEFRFTAIFDKKTIEQVLNALQLSRPFTYRVEEDGSIVIGSTRRNQ